MRNTHRNIIILTAAICFTAFGFIGGATIDAQTKSAKPTPKAKKSPTTTAKATPKATPKSKTTAKATPKTATKSASTAKTKATTKTDKATTKTDKPNTKAKPPTVAVKSKVTPKATPKPTPKTTPKPTAPLSQIIVVSTASRIREQPKANSTQLTTVKLGKTLPVSEKSAAWYRVEYAAGKSGWIPKTTVKDYETDRRDEIYLEIADKYFKNTKPDFATAAEVCEFLGTAQLMVRKDALKADLGFRRLRLLSAALRAIPNGKDDQSPYKAFLKTHEKDAVYSDPSGEWYVRSEVFWELHNRFTALPIAEDIAWEAAQNPIPGECEGYVNCYLYRLRAADGEYLNFYPSGKYSKKALTNITNLLQPIVADIDGKSVYAPPTDISDRAEFNRFLTELRTIISKMPDVDKAKTLLQINRLGEGYK